MSGAQGKVPEISIPHDKPDGQFVVRTINLGTGPVLKPGDLVTVDYLVKTWANNKTILNSRSRGGQPITVPVGRNALIPVMDRAIKDQRIGSRLLVIVPPGNAYGLSYLANVGVRPTDTVVFVLDLHPATTAAHPNTSPTH